MIKTNITQFSGFSLAPTKGIQVVILYSDKDLADIASKQCWDMDSEQGTSKVESVSMVNFDTLRESEGEKIPRELLTCDLIFVALKRSQQLSPWQEKWLNNWASARSGQSGVVVHLHHEITDRGEHKLCELIESLAKKADLELVRKKVETAPIVPHRDGDPINQDSRASTNEMQAAE